tara:strand:+ start:159 stop:2981 length:2823 start_codon:yes stop_codon:yes gene_type:complete
MDTEEPQEKKPKYWVFRTILGLVSAVFVLAVLTQLALWGAVAWLNTESGQDWINAKIKGALAGTGYRIEMTGLNYQPFTTFVIGGLQVFQNDALFVSGKNIYLHAELSPMMVKELIASATAEQIIFHKMEKPVEEQKAPVLLPIIEELVLPDLYFKTVTLTKVAVEDLQFSETLHLSPSLSSKIAFGPKRIRAKINLDDDSGFIVKKLSADSVLDMKAFLLSIKSLDLVSESFVVSSKGEYDLSAAELRVDAVLKMLGDGAIGEVLAQVSAKNSDAHIVGNFEIETKLREEKLAVNSGFKAGSSNVVLEGLHAQGLGAVMDGQASLDENTLMLGGVALLQESRIENFKLDIAHSKKPYGVSFTAKGMQGEHPVGLNLSFKADADAQAISDLRGKVSLKDSAFILSGAASMEMLNVKAGFKNFSVLDLPVNLNALPQDLIVNGSLSLTGTPEIPVVTSDLNIQPETKKPNVTITAKGGYKDKKIGYAIQAMGEGIKSFDGTVSIPVHLSLMPFHFDLTPSTPLSGDIKANLDVKAMAGLVLPPDQEVSGVLKANGKITGTLGQPDVSFDANMNDGKYHHKSAGFQLQDIDLFASMSGGRASLKSLRASDGEEGVLNASGFYDLNQNSFEIDVISKKLHALKGKLVDGRVDLDVDWKGDFKKSLIQGVIKPRRITVTIPQRFSQSIPSLQIIKPEDQKKKIVPFGQNIDLDIAVKAPQQIFVSGWGLDAEFGGTLDIGGSVYKPKIEGEFSSLRGKYEEFGRSFTIEYAKIKFIGASPPFPQLDVLSSSVSGNITAQIAIEGSIQKPSISFSSIPALPEDEVLSRILFGKSMEKITPFQAVELATTLQRFTGNGGGGVSAAGLVKSLTGLDDISVDTDDDGETTIGAGKYLTDKVYLEFETGTGEASGGANLEVEVTPNITLESEIGQDAQGGAGVFWHWDY